MDELRVTDKGWRLFADARKEVGWPLSSIRIKAAETSFVPSKETRAALLEGAVTESLVLYAVHRAGAGVVATGMLRDCDGCDVLEDEDRTHASGGQKEGKLIVTPDGPWALHWCLHAGHL